MKLVSEKEKSETPDNVIPLFKDAYKYYHDRQFNKSVELLQEALSKNPTDGPSKLYLQRCQDFIATPPPEDWDGVFIMKTK